MLKILPVLPSNCFIFLMHSLLYSFLWMHNIGLELLTCHRKNSSGVANHMMAWPPFSWSSRSSPGGGTEAHLTGIWTSLFSWITPAFAAVACKTESETDWNRSVHGSVVWRARGLNITARGGQCSIFLSLHWIFSAEVLLKWHVFPQHFIPFAHNTDTHNNLLCCVKLISADIFSPCSHERSVHFHSYF